VVKPKAQKYFVKILKWILQRYAVELPNWLDFARPLTVVFWCDGGEKLYDSVTVGPMIQQEKLYD
jgi:acyl-ACP thioesterase